MLKICVKLVSVVLIFHFLYNSAVHCQVIALPELYVGPSNGVRAYGQKIVINDKLFFYGNSEATGFEPCIFNLKTSTYKILKDINLGRESSEGFYFTKFNDLVLFIAKDSNGDTELYKYDSNNDSVELILNINKIDNGVSDVYTSASTEKGVFFTAKDERFGDELWITDGTALGTKIIRDIEPGKNGSYPKIYGYSEKLKKIIFSAFNSNTGYEFYVSDGTPQGTYLLLDIYTGPGSGAIPFAVVASDLFYFVGTSPSTGEHIYSTDGTVNGTKRATPTQLQFGDPYSLIPFGNKCIFFCNNTNMYITDGTEVGTIKLSDKLVPHEPRAIYTEYLSWVLYKNEIYFAGDQNGTGFNIELFKTDGSIQGTQLVKEIFNSGSSIISGLNVFNNRIYFAAYGAHKEHEELWTSDGTNSGTRLVDDINPGNEDSFPGGFAVYDSCLYFSAVVGFNGFELFKYCETISSSSNIKLSEKANLGAYYSNGLIYYNQDLKIAKFYLIDLLGRKTDISKFDLGTIHIGNGSLSNGVYFLVGERTFDVASPKLYISKIQIFSN